jgi:hypothetical protein
LFILPASKSMSNSSFSASIWFIGVLGCNFETHIIFIINLFYDLLLFNYSKKKDEKKEQKNLNKFIFIIFLRWNYLFLV